MPEGPSILILKEKLQSHHLEGDTIESASGNADIEMDKIIHKKILRFKTWGKHFLICCDGITIRIHLMMFGTYLINERKSTPLKLRLTFDDVELNFYTCIVKLIEGDLNKVYDWSADIMSEKWNTVAALKKIRMKPKSLVCDILLDQEIFSGVGNIIKNEALYRTGIHPLSEIASIPPRKLKSLIEDTRTYSFDFLKWKKENTLSKHWKIYSKKICPLGHEVDKINEGKNKRSSFVCPKCQKLYS
ncbi:DNA-formamidopyrimidine glycosylase family protein [Pedobacter sp. PWIIR3]